MKRKYAAYPLVDSDQRPEHAKFYEIIEMNYDSTLSELLRSNCNDIEFKIGMLFVYREILKDNSHWKIERQDPFKDYK